MHHEQTNKIFFTFIKVHYGEDILGKIQTLEKAMVKYSSDSSDPYYLQFFLCCY